LCFGISCFSGKFDVLLLTNVSILLFMCSVDVSLHVVILLLHVVFENRLEVIANWCKRYRRLSNIVIIQWLFLKIRAKQLWRCCNVSFPYTNIILVHHFMTWKPLGQRSFDCLQILSKVNTLLIWTREISLQSLEEFQEITICLCKMHSTLFDISFQHQRLASF